MSFQVIIETQNKILDQHFGLLDFGYLTVIHKQTDREQRFDTALYSIEDDHLVISVEQVGIDENDKPLVTPVDWEHICANKNQFKIEMYVGFDDPCKETAPPSVKYGRAYVDYGTHHKDSTLDIELDNYFE
ncbi:hypothetical protein [Photobacterium sp. GB-72]|uniref:hypothetical protein n=1 Tax=Photobacterium sp. GB-72 TaxID=2022105 RepID=UPI000D15A3CD|nr:hypothetical protein [Photobacterium sp. GB-72]PSV27615.1 hypothetical protein C9J40_19975 [Photobacterium sp. GB-72]